MKKTYIIPEAIVVNIGIVRPIAESVAVNNKTVNDDACGWVKEENTTTGGKSVWDEEW